MTSFVPAIPAYFVLTFGEELVRKSAHHLPTMVVYYKAGLAILGDAEADGGAGVEGIGIHIVDSLHQRHIRSCCIGIIICYANRPIEHVASVYITAFQPVIIQALIL